MHCICLVHICTYSASNIHVCVRINIYISRYLYIHVSLSKAEQISVKVICQLTCLKQFSVMYKYISIFIYVCVYILYRYIYKHTYIHICIYVISFSCPCMTVWKDIAQKTKTNLIFNFIFSVILFSPSHSLFSKRGKIVAYFYFLFLLRI